MIKKTLSISIIYLLLVCVFSTTFGVEFIYRGNKGYDHFSCGSDRRGGLVRVKKSGPNRYQIFSKRISGEFEISEATVGNAWCLGTVGAARVACGFCRMAIEDDLPFSNLIE